MNEQIKQIAERLRGLRDVLELTAEDIARDSDISAEEYRLAETGDYDISVSMLQKIARTYNVALDALMFGEDGQEFNLVIEGRMLINIEGKEIILNQGDSIYFNSKLPHGMKALDGKTVRFLAVIM